VRRIREDIRARVESLLHAIETGEWAEPHADLGSAGWAEARLLRATSDER
jgi:hypothetical protein